MTACVNKHTKKVAAVISASLVGALSLGVAVPAFAAEGDIDLQASIGTEWDGVTFEWSGTYDSVNGYWTVPAGEQFILKGATAADGTTAIPLSDLTVVYTDGTDVFKTVPETATSYTAYVLNGNYDGFWNWFKINTPGKLASLETAGEATSFSVKVVKQSVEGAVAVENADVNDTAFKYTGFDKNISFKDAAGKLIDPNNYTVESVSKVGNSSTTLALADVIDAGDYIATIKGIGSYEGTEQVEFTVDPIDLAKDDITVDTMVPPRTTPGDASTPNNTYFTFRVNGEEVNYNIFMVETASVTGYNGDDWTGHYGWNDPAKVKLQIHANTAWSDSTGAYAASNFVDAGYDKATADVLVVKQMVGLYFYDNIQLNLNTDGIYELTIDASKGESFDPAKLTCALGTGLKSLDRTVTVYRDGEETEDYATPGTLTAAVEVTAPKDLAYGGSATVEVKIVGKHYAYDPVAYISIDGKDVKNGTEYDGEAVVPSIVVKSGSTVVDAADYTVTYKDADGETVEGDIVEPGEYTGTIDFGNASYGINGENKPVTDIEFTFEVTKATVHSAKADKDFYAATGDAVTPLFTAWTGEDYDGLSVEIDPAKTGVSYYKAKEVVVDYGNLWTDEDDVTEWVKTGNPIKASDLKKAGNYIAVVTVPADDPHFMGEAQSAMFEIGEYATFSDVAGDAWYADAVYNAADLGYMTGISGTDLFMPMADITRAELAKVFANMAGEAFSPVYTPTKFGDVDPLAWYAGAVAWADEAGIVTGYDDVTFGPADKATREQVAVMLYRYAKGQGKDVSVEDADATLAAYKDADQVSDWAKEAMAWAVDNGIFGQGTDELWAKQNIQRCAVATIAVRFQPEALPEA